MASPEAKAGSDPVGGLGLARVRRAWGFLRAFRFSPGAVFDWLRLRRILEGACAVRTVAAGEDVGLFAALRRGPCTPEELRRRLQLPPECLRILLDSALHFRLVRRKGERIVPGRLLRRLWHSDGLGVAFTAYCVANAGAGAIAAIRRRPSARRGEEFYRAMGCADADGIRRYGSYMAATASLSSQVLARTWDLRRVERLLDVGGGLGHVSRALLRRHPRLRATVADLPAVCEEGRRLGGERLSFVPLDFLTQPLPAGHDAILFARVLHDWDGETADRLLAKAYAALAPGGEVAIYEILRRRELGNAGSVVVAQWEVLLGGTGGDVRTLEDYRRRLRRAGFDSVRARHPVDLQNWGSLITARRPG